jgi:sugar phosphate isomerase/epimerase
MFVDRTSGKFDWRGLPKAYFTQTPLTLDMAPEEFHIRRATELDVPVAHTGLSRWDDEHVAKIKALLAEGDHELIPAIGADFIVRGDAGKREMEGAEELLRRYADFGGVQTCKLCLMPMTYNRFRSDPPLREQLDLIIEALPPLVRVAEEAGIVLAWENHLDYRAAEVVEILEAIDSPNLRFLFDPGNALSVCEDPIDAVEIAAPYTVLVHAKDTRVLPWTPASAGYFACMYACPLGEGNIDLHRMVEILAARAPDPESLPLSVEVSPIPPYYDEDLWVERGVQWMKEQFPQHLEPRTRSGAAG